MRVAPAGKTRQLASLLDYEAAENPDATKLYGFMGDPACAAEVDAPSAARWPRFRIPVRMTPTHTPSSLPGFPEAPGTGPVFRVTRSGSVELVATGLSGAADLAVTDGGTIYVAELFGGQISQIVDGDVSVLVEVTEPAAVEVAPDGTLYATTDAFGNGQVVVVTP